MTKYIFPYGFQISFDGKIISFPAIKITLSKENSDRKFSFLILVDSGAEISLFTKGDAELLGLNIKKGEKIKIGGITGEKISAFLHTVRLKIGNKASKVKVAFSEEDNTPRVLGRNPIFSYFFIIFDNQRQNTIFIPRKFKSFEKNIY